MFYSNRIFSKCNAQLASSNLQISQSSEGEIARSSCVGGTADFEPEAGRPVYNHISNMCGCDHEHGIFDIDFVRFFSGVDRHIGDIARD